MAWVLRAGLSLARRALVKKARSLARGEGRFRAERVCFGGHARGAGAGKGCAGLARRRGPARVFVKRRRRVRAARGVFSTRRRASGSSVYLRDARGARRELRAANGAAGASRGPRWPRADSLLAATRCGRASEWLGLPPGGVISVARAGAGHWQALFRRLPCPAGLFGRKLRHPVSGRDRSAGSGSKVGPRGPLAPAGVAAARCLKA